MRSRDRKVNGKPFEMEIETELGIVSMTVLPKYTKGKVILSILREPKVRPLDDSDDP